MDIFKKWLLATTAVMSVGAAALVLSACDRDQGAQDPSNVQGQPVGYDQYGQPIYPPQPGGYPPQPGGYPPQPGGYPPQPGGYPPQPGGYPPQPGGYPPQPAPASQPSPLSVPCQSDFTCGTHKCNLQVGRCAVPCANSQTDCAAGMACVNGVCFPGR